MLKLLQQLSATIFFILGVTFFVAFLLVQNNVQSAWSAWWMQVADLPFIVSAVTYGATSFLLSVKGRKASRALTTIVLVLCFLLLAAVFTLNFWGVF